MGEYWCNSTVLQQVFPNTNWASNSFQQLCKCDYQNILWCHIIWASELLLRVMTMCRKDTSLCCFTAKIFKAIYRDLFLLITKIQIDCLAKKPGCQHLLLDKANRNNECRYMLGNCNPSRKQTKAESHPYKSKRDQWECQRNLICYASDI